MMAKMFYTLEETKAALGKSEEEIKQFAREGRLREFRDGPRLMSKADQVDQVKADMGGGAPARPDLGPSDSGTGMALGADPGASGSGVISLADTDFGKASMAGSIAKEDTALAQDLGLSGSMGGVPSPGRSAGGPGGTATGSRAGGITVFDVDDAHRPDPAAQTSMGSGVQEQVNLEGTGSGSGLLDLTRESDDTSLGAELLDEITPGGTQLGGTAVRRAVAGDSGVAMDQLAAAGGVNRSRLAAPMYVEKADPAEMAFGLVALAGAIIVLFGAFVVINAVFGVRPDMVAQAGGKNGVIYLAGAAVVSVVLFLIGWVVGKGATR